MSVVRLYKNMSLIPGAELTVVAGETKKVTLTDLERRFVAEVDKLTFTVDGGAHSPEWVPPQGRWIQEFRATGDATEIAITITVRIAS